MPNKSGCNLKELYKWEWNISQRNKIEDFNCKSTNYKHNLDD